MLINDKYNYCFWFDCNHCISEGWILLMENVVRPMIKIFAKPLKSTSDWTGKLAKQK